MTSPSPGFSTTWHFLPAPGEEARFVRAYGPDGPWCRLFRRDPAYLGTDFGPVPGNPGWYFTIDRWTTEDAYRAFRERHAAEYARIDRECEALTASEVRVS